MVGIETSDGAAIYRVTDDIDMIQTVDFFTPVVDDPYTFGRCIRDGRRAKGGSEYCRISKLSGSGDSR